jgi:hypothetical protein
MGSPAFVLFEIKAINKRGRAYEKNFTYSSCINFSESGSQPGIFRP